MAISSLGVLRRSKTKFTRGLLVVYMLGYGVYTACKLCVNIEKLKLCKLCVNFILLVGVNFGQTLCKLTVIIVVLPQKL
jgi:hypothetical protein